MCGGCVVATGLEMAFRFLGSKGVNQERRSAIGGLQTIERL